ncbi:MAG: hypothetical protein AB7P21_11685 [Lautropia sp.]
MKPSPAPAAALRIATEAMRAPFAHWRRPEPNLQSAPDASRARPCSLEAICARLQEGGHHVLGPVVSPAIRIDRILVGPAGVFALRSWGAADGLAAGAQIKVDADGVACDALAWGTDPIERARITTSYLHALLRDAPGWRAQDTVLPVLLFEGCAVEQSPLTRSRLWAIESGALEPMIEALGARLDPVVARAAAQQLEAHFGAKAALR